MRIQLTTIAQPWMRPGEGYTKDNSFYRDLGKTFLPGPAMQSLKQSVSLLRSDKAQAEKVHAPIKSNKILSDEEIYLQRKKSVLIIGKIIASGADGQKNISFDLMGTSFAISLDGVCVTNYHVLKEIFRENEGLKVRKDSIYFIETADKELFIINRIIAFSKKNDLAVFKVASNEHQFDAIPFGKPADNGAPVYCISHPFGHFYYFSKGIVAKNVTIDDTWDVFEGFDKTGAIPVRIEITADYAIGSSGGPMLEKKGNLVGVVISATPIVCTIQNQAFVQMMVKDTAPITALNTLLKNNIGMYLN